MQSMYCKKLHKHIIEKSVLKKKISDILDDSLMYCLSYHDNAKTKRFYSTIFEKGAISIIDQISLICSSSIIDNILTTYIFNNSLKEGVIKSEVLSHLAIFSSMQPQKKTSRRCFRN